MGRLPAFPGDVFAEELPWLTWLPAEGRSQRVTATAEIYSDPELVRRLSGPFYPTDAVEVERPGGPDA